MPIQMTKDGRLTWEAGQKPRAIMGWLICTVSHRAIGLPGARLAALLADSFNDKTGACWKTNDTMAGETDVSESAIKAGLQQLEAAGSIIRVEEMVGRKMMRVIYPRDPIVIEGKEPRKPRGGVPKGIDPKARKAELSGSEIAELAAPSASLSGPAAGPIDAVLVACRERGVAPDPNARSYDPIQGRIYAVLHWKHSAFPRDDRRQLTNAGAAAARAALEQGEEAFAAWCLTFLAERDRWTCIPVYKTKKGTDPQTAEGTETQTGEETEGRSVKGAVDQSGIRSAGQTPCIPEKSIDRSMNPIPSREASYGEVLGVMCVHRDCRTPARFVCTASARHYCTRHRGEARGWEELK